MMRLNPRVVAAELSDYNIFYNHMLPNYYRCKWNGTTTRPTEYFPDLSRGDAAA